MYKVSIFNNNIETVIHYPSADADDPHLNKLPLTEGLSVVDKLTFTMYTNNPGYEIISELTTKIKVSDVRDESIRFTGRILNINEKMDNTGLIYKEVTCEGALSYLNDTKQRNNTFVDLDVRTFLTQLLNIHNNKVESGRKIFIGALDVVGQVVYTCDFKTTLSELLEVKKIIGGDIRVREVNGALYLDWLKSFNSNTVDIVLGTNMKDMVISKDITSFGTRIIPLGANNLTITSVNGGLDYIDDTLTKNVYGVIEKIVEYKDIKDPTTLFNTCVSDMKKYTQPPYILGSNALDLSYLTGIKSDQFVLGTALHLVNPVMAIDDIYNIVQINVDLINPHNPDLTISNVPVTFTNDIQDLKRITLHDDGVYNNVQIGKSFGIRVVRNDNKVITTMNATDGISIENDSKKVFFVDINGNITTNDINANDMTVNRGTFNDIKSNRGVFDDMTANRGTFTDIKSTRGTFDDMTVNRGTFKDIKATGGTFDNITASGGTFDNITATNGLTITDGTSTCKVNSAGITLTDGDYTSTMTVSQSDADGTNITFGNGVVVSDDFVVKGSAYFDGNLVMIGADSIKDYIDDRIIAKVKSDSLI